MRIYKTGSTRIRFYLKTENFFSGMSWRPHVFCENGHRKRILSKHSTDWKFLKHSFPVLACKWSKRRFLKTITSRCWIQLHAHVPNKDGTVFSHHCISWGRAKPIEKRNVWTRISLKTEGKLSILIQNGYVSTEPKCFSIMVKKAFLPRGLYLLVSVSLLQWSICKISKCKANSTPPTADVFPVVASLWRERSDHRKYVCGSQAKLIHDEWLL